MNKNREKKKNASGKPGNQNKVLICNKVQVGETGCYSDKTSDLGINVDSAGRIIRIRNQNRTPVGENASEARGELGVVQSLITPGAMINSKGFFVCVNEEFTDLCGYDPDELISTSLSDLFVMKRQGDADLSSLWKRRIQHWEGFLTLRCKDGQVNQVRVVIRPYCRSKYYWLMTVSTDSSLSQTISCTLPPGNTSKQISPLPGRRTFEFDLTLDNLQDFCTSECTSLESHCDLTVQNIASTLKCDLAISALAANGRLSHISLANNCMKSIDIEQARHLCEYVYERRRPCRISGDFNNFFDDNSDFVSLKLKGIIGIPVESRNGHICAVVVAADSDPNIIEGKSFKLLKTISDILTLKLDSFCTVHSSSGGNDDLILSQITSGLAHEVRNPLNGIVSLSDALNLDLGENGEYEEYFRHISKQTERLSILTKELLELGSSVLPEQMHPHSLADLCSEALKVWNTDSPHQGRTVHFTAPLDETNAVVLLCKNSFITVIKHLLNNAAQHSDPESDIVLDIAEPGETNIVVRIIDKGRGLLPDGVDRIFDPFFTTEKSHYGLGLSIVKRIVVAHGGSITIKNNRRRGCTVGLKLPLFL
ncbi:MAG: ATP-binding protein [Chitinispirillaceae bacterium]